MFLIFLILIAILKIIYSVNNIDIIMDDNIFINIRDINDLRRRLLKLLDEKRLYLNEFEDKSDKLVKVPLLGKITAGSPIEAIEMPDEYFALPTYLIPQKKEVFTLRVDGDSMINAGIFTNDIVIVERCNAARNGEIVVAMNDDNEVTLKTFYKEKDYIRLQPENDYMNPIILKNVTILGKAIGLYRKF